MRCGSYAFGNCTEGACQENPWIPEHLGDGGDWAFRALQAGLQVTSIPTVGSVVCYCRGHGYSEFGHVGTVLAVGADGRFLVHEENFVGFATWDSRWSTSYDVCGFILPPGTAPGRGASAGLTGGGGPSGLVPWAPIGAWETVRDWTRNLGAELYGRALNVSNLADQLPG